jgi:flagellar basal-body rod protein FlgF
MERGLYIAATGMISEIVRQDQIANDLSNSSTPGYKADRAAQRSFEEVLLQNTATGQVVGPMGFGVQIDEIRTDMRPGPLRLTQEALDFGIDGEGFFAVQSPQGVRYSRNGQFSVNAQGQLVNSMGMQVLSQNGAPIEVPRGGRVNVAQIGVFDVPNARKEGESLFTGAAGGRAAGQVRQGVLEGSGAEPARSMVDMIASFRAFEASQKVIRTIDDTLQRAAGQVGALSA